MKRALALAAASLLASPASADVVEVPCARDTTLWNDPAGQVANGAGPVAFVGRAGSSSLHPVRRALVRFDVAAHLPAGATIRSAQLVLSNPSGNVGPRLVELRRVLADWGEGASSTSSGQGAPAEPGDATWIHTFHPQGLWTTSGGDAAALASATLVVDQLGLHTFPSTPLAVADVQDWLDQPATSFGWLVRLADEGLAQTTKVIETREALDPALRPKLVVEFDPPPGTYCPAQPTGLGCLPAIGWSGVPSATSGPFTITLSNAPSRKAAALTYGTSGAAALPFLGHTLCVAPPLRQLGLAPAASPSFFDDCTGSRVLDFRAWIASGLDPALVAGAHVRAQWLGRDPLNALGAFYASDALRFVIGP